MKTALVTSDYEQARGKPMPSKNHSIIQRNLLVKLAVSYGDRLEIVPEINVIAGEQRRVPDIAMFASLSFTPGKDEIQISESPLGVIEILSPSQNLSELIQKSIDYFTSGVKSYWLVLPDLRTIYVFGAPNEYEVYTKEAQLDDPRLNIQLDLSEIFRS